MDEVSPIGRMGIRMKVRTYYYVEWWNGTVSKWHRSTKHECIEEATESAEYWTNIVGRSARVIEVRERMVARFISKVASKPNGESA
jgi:hypothetical protein